jgi:hypothetical protein
MLVVWTAVRRMQKIVAARIGAVIAETVSCAL